MENNSTLGQFIRDNGITSVTRLRGIATDADGWEHRRWTITLRRGELGVDHQEASFPFRTGMGIVETPTAADLLNSLALDASGLENSRSFEEWCGEYGLDPDSRKAEKAYKATQLQTAKLRAFLTSAQYDTLLWHTDSL